MQAFFWFMVLISLIGWVVGTRTFERLFLYNNDKSTLYQTTPMKPTTWVAIQCIVTKPQKVKVRFLGNPARELAKDIEIASDRHILAETYNGYSYSEILASLTPEQIDAIKEMRSFLK